MLGFVSMCSQPDVLGFVSIYYSQLDNGMCTYVVSLHRVLDFVMRWAF